MKKSFILYQNWEKIFAKLSHEQQGKLIMSIFAYTGRGEEVSDSDPVIEVAFAAMQDALDDNEQKYRDTLAKRSEAGKKGGRPRKIQDEPEVQDETHGEISVGAEIEKTEKSKCFSKNPVTDIVTDIETDIYSPSHSLCQRYGQYGWVEMTEVEYQDIVTALGEPEVKRCIDYLDESAQVTNNRNQWQDWATLILKASREQWGKKSNQPRCKSTLKKSVQWGSAGTGIPSDLEKRAMDKMMAEFSGGTTGFGSVAI